MFCIECNIEMKNGTSYEKKGEKMIIRKYCECRKCHFRKYKDKTNQVSL